MLKPNRVLKRFTYAVPLSQIGQPSGLMKLDKDAVRDIMLDSLLSHYNRKDDLILNTITHRLDMGNY